MTRRISSSRPMTGSSLPARARSVISTVYFFQRLAAALGFRALHVLAAAHCLDCVFQRRVRPAVLFQQPSGLALVLGERQHEYLGGDELVTALARFLVGQIEQVGKLARNVDLAALAFDFRQALDRRLERIAKRRHVHARALQQGNRRAVFLFEQRGQQMLRLYVRIVVADGEALRIGKRLLKLGGKFIETHSLPH